MSRLGRFELLRKIGVGGMGAVWKAAVQGPEGFRKIVAVKRIRSDAEQDMQELVDMFIGEAKLVAQLQHPSIVQVFDFGAVDPAKTAGALEYFIAMEYVAGRNLSQVLDRLQQRGGKLARDVVIFIVTEVARALAYAHGTEGGRSVVHRDISPHNILISYDGAVKITDFGIALSVAGNTGTGEVRGKFKYMSPEQIRAEHVDHRTDIFALGVVLYELLTGQPLFTGEPAHIAYQLTHFDPSSSPRILVLDPAMRVILSRALAPDKENRYSDALELESALTGALEHRQLVMARRALIALMRLAFEEEYQKELADQEADSTEQAPDAVRTVAVSVSPDVSPSQTSLKAQSLFPEEATPLPDPFGPGQPDPWSGTTGEFTAESGSPCRSCGKTVEPFLGDSDLCFTCLDATENANTGDTGYVQVSSAHAPVQGNVVEEGGREPRPVLDPDAPYGWLWITCDQPADVWINGVRAPMPVEHYSLPPGQHRVVAIASGVDLRLEESVVLHAGVEVNLFIDVKNRSLRRW